MHIPVLLIILAYARMAQSVALKEWIESWGTSHPEWMIAALVCYSHIMLLYVDEGMMVTYTRL